MRYELARLSPHLPLKRRQGTGTERVAGSSTLVLSPASEGFCAPLAIQLSTCAAHVSIAERRLASVDAGGSDKERCHLFATQPNDIRQSEQSPCQVRSAAPKIYAVHIPQP